MKSRFKNHKDKRPPGGFVALPYIVIRSPQWARLSPMAVKLVCDLLGQYDGRNNGDLTAAWTIMAARGWRSRDSLEKAQRELEAAGWIQRTRQGGRHLSTLWAITMFALDDDNPTVKAKLDILPRDFDRGSWSRATTDPPTVSVNGDSVNPPTVSIEAGLTRGPGQSHQAERVIDPPAVSVDATFALQLTRRPCTSTDLPGISAASGDPPYSESVRELPARPENEFERSQQRWQTQQARRARMAAKRVRS